MKAASAGFSSVLAGVAGALATGVLALVAAFAVGFMRVWWSVGSGAGEIGAFGVVVPELFALVLIAGFAVGFFWRYRALRRRSRVRFYVP